MKRVVLAMSGGVDSSVAAYLLRAEGYEVIGLFMRSGVHAETEAVTSDQRSAVSLPILDGAEGALRKAGRHKGCCSAEDAADARCVADKLDIPFYALDFQEEFGRIMDYFADEYVAGRTPNPCVVCNNWLKFGRLWDYARQVGADYIATGHYARVDVESLESEHSRAEGQRSPADSPLATDSLRSTGDCPPPTAQGHCLLRAVDADKDQSYVLFGLRRDLLPHILFPIGGYRKEQIRAIARCLDLRVADKADSQEICFVPSGHYAEFVRRRRPQTDLAGLIVDTKGQVVGRHEGIEHFTVGQRKGLGVALGSPRYVVALERDTCRVVVGTKEELGRSHLEVHHTNWLVDEPRAPLSCQVKIRYRHMAAPAWVDALPSNRAAVTFHEPQYGVAPGQAAVFYDGEQVLGGGWIEAPK